MEALIVITLSVGAFYLLALIDELLEKREHGEYRDK